MVYKGREPTVPLRPLPFPRGISFALASGYVRRVDLGGISFVLASGYVRRVDLGGISFALASGYVRRVDLGRSI